MASRANRVTKTYSRRNRNYDPRNRNHGRTFPPESVHPSPPPPQPLVAQAIDVSRPPSVSQENRAHNGLEYTLRIMCDSVACVERIRETRCIQNTGQSLEENTVEFWHLPVTVERDKGFRDMLNLPIDIQAPLYDPLSNPDGFVEAVKMVKLRYPQFTCPACRSVMTKRPIPFAVMEHVFTDLCVPERGDTEAAPPLQLDLSQNAVYPNGRRVHLEVLSTRVLCPFTSGGRGTTRIQGGYLRMLFYGSDKDFLVSEGEPRGCKPASPPMVTR
ncbi:hypothetical protein BDM02DRAFT_3132878 [Thelephora ganbajun]|uniref:Uncharacterized protein n=1 Tax=Thelephora ganbajun TaxID=370292 RepID=A0ACB6YZ63_THEGA|nr:hypothetical protein BDM02DRAFT_3132878 [Thelephora ganbajun]